MYLLDKYQYIVGNYISCVFHGLAPRPAGAAGQVRRLTDSGDPVVFFHTLSVLRDLLSTQSRACVCIRISPKLRPPKLKPCWTRPVTVTLTPLPGTPKFWLTTQMRPVPSSTWKTPFPMAPNESDAWPEIVMSLLAKRLGSRVMSAIGVRMLHPVKSTTTIATAAGQRRRERITIGPP